MQIHSILISLKEVINSFIRLSFKKFFLVISGILYNRMFDLFNNVDTLPHLDQSILIKKDLKNLHC